MEQNWCTWWKSSLKISHASCDWQLLNVNGNTGPATPQCEGQHRALHSFNVSDSSSVWMTAPQCEWQHRASSSSMWATSQSQPVLNVIVQRHSSMSDSTELATPQYDSTELYSMMYSFSTSGRCLWCLSWALEKWMMRLYFVAKWHEYSLCHKHWHALSSTLPLGSIRYVTLSVLEVSSGAYICLFWEKG